MIRWRALLFLTALGLAACDSDPDPASAPAHEVVVGRRTYLLDLPPGRHSYDGERAAAPGPSRFTVEKIICGAEVRRGVMLGDGELVFHDVIEGPGRLQFEVGFGKRGEVAPTRFEVEVTALGPGGERQVVWASEAVRPPAARWQWQSVEVELTGLNRGDLGFRVRPLDGDLQPDTHRPAIANPVVIDAGRPVAVTRSTNRNLVVFLVDTLRADHLGCYGYPRETSPRLDALAAESLVFEDACATSSWTKASIASLFTARYPSQHGAEGYVQRMSDAPATLAEVLGRHGHATAAIGHSEWIFNPIFNVNKGFEESYYVLHGSALNHTPANRVLDEALAWLDHHYQEPFFLYVHTVDPHAPYSPEAEADYFRDGPYEGDLTPTNLGPQSFLRRSADQVSEEDLAYLIDLYDAEIRFNDAQIGRLIDRLQELGLWEETTFVVVSDHGEEFLDHEGWSHGGTLYQEQLRVPLLVKPPRSAHLPPGRVRVPVSATELAPALCDLLEVDTGEAGWAPASFASWRDAEVASDAPILGELNKEKHVGFSLRRGAVKYIWSLVPEEREEVYRLDRDPTEQEDLLETVDPGVLNSLRDTMQALRAMTVRGGLLIEFQNRSDEAVELTASLSSDAAIQDFNLEAAERATESATRSRDGRSVTVRMVLSAGDRDALLVRVGPEDRLELQVSGPGGRWPAESLRLGPGFEPAPAGHFRLADLEEGATGERPADVPEVACHVTRRQPAALKLSAEVLENLRAMGYVIGE